MATNYNTNPRPIDVIPYKRLAYCVQSRNLEKGKYMEFNTQVIN